MQIYKKYTLFLSLIACFIGLSAQQELKMSQAGHTPTPPILPPLDTLLKPSDSLVKPQFRKKDTLTSKTDTLTPSLSKVADTLKMDSLRKSPAMLTDVVRYHAKDCVVISKPLNRVLLYDESQITYEDTDL
ncbi:MAG: LPS-assembly protein LptD, partial [Capnocytophaga granulosa]